MNRPCLFLHSLSEITISNSYWAGSNAPRHLGTRYLGQTSCPVYWELSSNKSISGIDPSLSDVSFQHKQIINWLRPFQQRKQHNWHSLCPWMSVNLGTAMVSLILLMFFYHHRYLEQNFGCLGTPQITLKNVALVVI